MSTESTSPEHGATAPAAGAAKPRRRVMGLLDITLFTVSAMLVVDQLTASASIGTNTIAWWLVCIVVFLVPYGLIASELAHHLPRAGWDLRLGEARVRSSLGDADDLLVLGQRRDVDAVGLPAVRRRLLAALLA